MDALALRREVESVFESEQLPFLEHLVLQPSCTRAPQDVEAAAKLIDARAQELGLIEERFVDPEGRFADHRVYRTAAAGVSTPALMLVGHVDTVFPREMGFDTFERRGNRIFGPGVLDMKSGLSVILFAIGALHRLQPDFGQHLALRFACVTDEEVGSPSSAALHRRLAKVSHSALVFEAGREEDKIVTRRKGAGFWSLKVHGRAAHAGTHHADGRSALVGLAHLIVAIESMTDHGAGVTLNVGLAGAGTAKNTVPEWAWADVDGRFLDLDAGERLARELSALIASPADHAQIPESARALFSDLEITLEGGISRPPMVATAESQALRLRYEAHAARVGLQIGEAPLSGGGSDANFYSALGVPTLDGLGPHGQHYHRREEWSDLDSLLRRTQALALFLAETLG